MRCQHSLSVSIRCNETQKQWSRGCNNWPYEPTLVQHHHLLARNHSHQQHSRWKSRAQRLNYQSRMYRENNLNFNVETWDAWRDSTKSLLDSGQFVQRFPFTRLHNDLSSCQIPRLPHQPKQSHHWPRSPHWLHLCTSAQHRSQKQEPRVVSADISC